LAIGICVPQIKTAPRPAASPAASDWHARAHALAASLHLDTDELLARAVEAFAVAHGRTAIVSDTNKAAEIPAASTPEPAPTLRAASRHVSVQDEPPALAPDVRLYVHGNGRPPQEMIGERYTIGSSNRCDLWVNMPKVETKHLRITREGHRYFAEDLGTEAGTVYGGRRLEGRHEIKHEDSLFLAGYHRIKFYLLS
jgi:hypothetical protein